MSVRLKFHGAARTVTGSCYLLETGQSKVLVDCGMFQGSPHEVIRNQMAFPFEPSKIDALLLTHAHLDHCGRTPALVKAGFRGPIRATSGTLDLAEIVLRDLIPDSAASEITAPTIMAVTSDFFSVSMDDLCGPGKTKALAQARQSRRAPG